MSAKNEKVEAPKQKFEWVSNPKGLIEIYGNYAHASWTLYDVRMLVGKLRPELGDSSKFVVEEQAAIYITWPHLKSIVAALQGIIESYESVNGEIEPIKLAPRQEDRKKSEGS